MSDIEKPFDCVSQLSECVPQIQMEIPIPEIQMEIPIPEIQMEIPIPEIQMEIPIPQIPIPQPQKVLRFGNQTFPAPPDMTIAMDRPNTTIAMDRIKLVQSYNGHYNNVEMCDCGIVMKRHIHKT
jgi:hypothetical protein